MKRLFLVFLMISFPAYAQTAREGFEGLRDCVATTPNDCREMVTAGSVEYYDKFVEYGLARCLPASIRYVSEEAKGDYRVVRSGANVNKQMRYARLAFAEEEGAWKLDLPETFRRAFGEKWPQVVEATEQGYVLLKTQLGDRVGCSTIQALVPEK